MKPITEEERKKIYIELTNALIAGLRNGSITVDDSQTSAQFILDRLESMTDLNMLVVFLQDLSSRWKAYASVYMKYKAEETKLKDSEKLASVQSKLQEFITT